MRTILCLALGVIFGCSMEEVPARDVGQWETGDPAVRDWYRSLMQPDMPLSSCCGEADAYWADSYQIDGDRYVAIITDPRPDEPLHRRHIDIGTMFAVPNHKLKYEASNPTGHGIIFLNPYDFVLCYLPPGGV
jgi:hypothetical protein